MNSTHLEVVNSRTDDRAILFACRGYQTGRLRVVRSNTVAVQFYLGEGWQIAREFAHEKYYHPTLELAKPLPASSDSAL